MGYKLRDWASVAGIVRLLLSGSVAHASLKTAVLRPKMNCTVRFGKQFSESSPCLPGQHCRSREQGSRAGMPVELPENSLQNLLYSSFWDVVYL